MCRRFIDSKAPRLSEPLDALIVQSFRQNTSQQGKTHRRSAPSRRHSLLALASFLLAPLLIALTGCGTTPVTASPSNATFSLSPAISSIDTNCTGCNSLNERGAAVHRFAATLANGSPATVTWSVSGGDASAGAGSIDAAGQYMPPGYLTAERATVMVTARLASDPTIVATTQVTVTPGFLQPLTPENVTVGPGSSVTLTGRLAEAGGFGGIQFALANSATGSSGGLGSLGPASCQHTDQAFMTCSVTYTAPATISSTGVTYVVAIAGNGAAKTDTAILLSSTGVTSNPTTHQGLLATLMPLGSSGGNNNDFDAHGNTITDCCSGTLGALIQDNSGRQYLLSNNHVLARSDHASVGDAIVQPGLIDNNCTPNGEGPGTVPVASLTAWLPLQSHQTNVDAAIAQVASRTVDNGGSILELGSRQGDGTLAAAPPGVSSTAGRGENAGLQLRVAKSGRTTGLTCASVSAVNLDISVDYFRDCAETQPYLTKTFRNQFAISGDRFSDAGDSGALVVDVGNAEPVGLFFAGGTDAAGVGQAVANPAPEVLEELAAQTGSGAGYSFVGGADHPVSCLSYGDSTVAAAQSRALSGAESARGQQALSSARSLINPGAGILGVSMGKSSDHPGEAAVLVYVDENMVAAVPQTVGGVRTLVIPSTARALAMGAAPSNNTSFGMQALSGSVLSHASQIKQQVARGLMGKSSAFFGVGVGQSLDNPREAALVIYVNRNLLPAHLPTTMDGLRTRYVVMDRLHVTRSYAHANSSSRHCTPQRTTGSDPDRLILRHGLNLPF